MTNPAHLSFDVLNAALKAAGEDTRLRVLVLLAEAELTVSDLTQILRQSQPRISRHLKLLVEAGLVERFREGAWAFFRLAERGGSAELARTLIARLDASDPIAMRDRERLSEVRRARAAAAQDYFRAHAAQWDRIRKLHVADEAVENAIHEALAGQPFHSLLDLGTGTGRMLELFGANIERGLGIDLSPDMLQLARARIERAGFRHCSVRQGDIYDLAVPAGTFDAEQRLPQLRHRFFDVPLRRRVLAQAQCGEVRRRQGLHIHFSVDGQRQLVEPDIRGRQHVRRQLRGQLPV